MIDPDTNTNDQYTHFENNAAILIYENIDSIYNDCCQFGSPLFL
jgi:hypothetical protein